MSAMRVFVPHDPLAAVEPRLENAEQALRFVHIALQRPLILVFAPGEFVEEADLAEYRPDRGHLEENPFDGLVAARRIGGHELAGLLGEIEQDGAGFEQTSGFPPGPSGSMIAGILPFGIEREEFRQSRSRSRRYRWGAARRAARAPRA